MTHLGGPPIANQFVGAFLFVPLLLGSLVSTRVAPHKLVLFTKLALLPISVLMAGVVGGGAVQIWMVYPFMFAYGIGALVNMTAQRELFFTMAGPLHSSRVLNAEVTGTASAMMLGPLLGGVTIQVFGLGAAFSVLALLLMTALPLLWYSTRALPARPAAVKEPAVPGRSDWRLLRDSRALAVILVVTVICNLCYFAFLPLVPVIAERLHAEAATAGVIGATAGLVQLVVAAALIFRPPRRPFRAYAWGVAICLCSLGFLSYAPVLSLALLALAVAGVGQALFGSTQATLPVGVVEPQHRVAALGLLATTIGVALPTGMIVLGVASSLLGARLAMLVSAIVGLAALVTTVLLNRSGGRSSDRAIGVGRECDSVTTQAELG
ncbi:MFS transporter [Mycolicibacterium mengxianglii]|uniref:MFS transporter n=1 Tax=Mycolicibacterium mengxianglii TaxID=2736649 RepID=UPI0018D05D1D|nr:MFS transporter [Mycolicibacterium mengxianglii]